jgi:glutamate--cysteine ligase
MDDADRTPSARILARLKDERIPFFRFAMNQSLAHREYFLAHPLSDEREEELRAVSEASHEEQKRIEAADVQSFDEYIETYLSQDLLVPQSREQHAS